MCGPAACQWHTNMQNISLGGGNFLATGCYAKLSVVVSDFAVFLGWQWLQLFCCVLVVIAAPGTASPHPLMTALLSYVCLQHTQYTHGLF